MIRTLEITPWIGCSNMCIYCPQDKLISAYIGNKIMSLGQFETILDNTPKDIQINFTGFCESFLNPNASLMMKMAIERGYETVIYTTLTGFTDNDAVKLKGLLFAQVVIHEYEGHNIDRETFDKKTQLFRDSIQAHDFQQFRLDPIHRNSRAGNLWETPVKKGKFWCHWAEKEFKRNVVLPNGDVYLCCSDFSLKHKLGNMYNTHYNDLDRQKIIDLSDQEDSEIICRKCELFRS